MNIHFKSTKPIIDIEPFAITIEIETLEDLRQIYHRLTLSTATVNSYTFMRQMDKPLDCDLSDIRENLRDYINSHNLFDHGTL